jgi:hypothetical protein
VLQLNNPNKGSKIADAGVSSCINGHMPVYPGIQVEVGVSDGVKENFRDCSLWVSSTDLSVNVPCHSNPYNNILGQMCRRDKA